MGIPALSPSGASASSSRPLFVVLALAGVLTACASRAPARMVSVDAVPPLSCPESATAQREGLRQWCEQDGAKAGPFRAWHRAGRLQLEGAFVAGLREGPWTSYDETGALVSTGNYLTGERSGEWTFFSAGEPFRIGSYDGGLEVGVWTTFHAGPARQKSEQGTFIAGERHGEWLTWYTSGVLSSRSTYEEGQQITLERFDALGNPLTR